MTKAENLQLSNDEKLGFISSLATMFSAGIPLLEIIISLEEYSKGNQKKMIELIREDISQGKQFNVSLSRFPKIFDKVTINILRASEEAGTLDVALKDLRKNLKKSIEFKDKIRSALIYPILIIVVFFGILLMMLVFVIPKISDVFSRLQVDLPLPTRVLIFVSESILNFTIPILIGTVIIAIVGIFFYKHKKREILHVITSIPPLSNLTKQIDLTQFTHSLYLLLNAGITVTSALELAENIVIQRKTAKAIRHAKDVIMTGKSFSEGLKDSKDIFPPLMIKIVEAGEKSGNLEDSLQDASEFLDYEVSKALKSFTILLEPIMLIVVGVLVGGMMLAIIAPIYGLVGQVGNR